MNGMHWVVHVPETHSGFMLENGNRVCGTITQLVLLPDDAKETRGGWDAIPHTVWSGMYLEEDQSRIPDIRDQDAKDDDPVYRVYWTVIDAKAVFFSTLRAAMDLVELRIAQKQEAI